MRIVVKRAGQYPEMKEIPNELHEFQSIVGGYIQCFQIIGNVLCVCNEEGKLKGLRPNFMFGNDMIVGDVFFCSAGEEDFEDLSATDTDWLMNVLNLMEMKMEMKREK